MCTSKEDLQVLVVGRSFVIVEFDDVDAWHITPEAFFVFIVPCWCPFVADEGGLAKLLCELGSPMLLFERGLTVLLVVFPMFCLTGFAAVLLTC